MPSGIEMINRAKEKDGTPARVLLVGVGGYGRVYVQATRKLESDGLAVISAVVDPLAENSPEWPALAEAGVALFKTVEEFVQSENEADLAVISSPIAFHADQACAALKAGMNVLCEKPLCATVEDARRMVQASENSGGFMEIGYQWSFSRAIQDLKSDVMAGRLGAPERLKTGCRGRVVAIITHETPGRAGFVTERDGVFLTARPTTLRHIFCTICFMFWGRPAAAPRNL